MASPYLHSFALFFSLLNPFLMSIYMIGLIRHSEAKVFNKALIQGSLIAFVVFMLFAWGGETIFSKYLNVRFEAFQIFGGLIFLVIGYRYVFQGADTIAAMIAEPVMGAGGVIVPPEGYWPRVQEICRQYDILLHIDEVVCGLGRTGTWFGYQHYGIQPDFVTMAKGLASGYAAISCTVTTEEIFNMFKDDASDSMSYFRDISTFGGCTAGPAAALENMRIIEDEGLLDNTLRMGARLMDNLAALQDKHAVIGQVRGKGLFCGAELVADRVTKEAADEKKVAAVVADCMAQGVIIGMTNRSLPGLNNTLCLSPALIATADDIDAITGAIDGALTRVFG